MSGSGSADWFAAWNGRDAQAILALYADPLTFISPFVRALGMSPDGVLRSRSAFARYLQAALPRVPDLKFEPIAECIGLRGRTLVYRNQAGSVVAESHEYDAEGLITRADAAYSAPTRES